jgi:hypothetical protein
MTREVVTVREHFEEQDSIIDHVTEKDAGKETNRKAVSKGSRNKEKD